MAKAPVPAKDFYSPRELLFTRKQVCWVIQNLGSLRTGFWPPDASNYFDTNLIQKQTKGMAPFIIAVECYIEISSRMERCGIDGLILLAIECWGESEEALAKYLEMPEWSVRKRYKNALGYVASGPARRWHDTLKRKGESYQEFRIRRKKK